MSKKNKNTVSNIIGWTGTVLLFANYILLSFGVIIGESFFYQTVALLGCLCIAFEARKEMIPSQWS